jgi:hypothetical protein
MKPFIKMCQRNGHVFLRIVYRGPLGRESRMVRLEPELAKAIGDELLDLAARAAGKHKSLKLR